MEQDESEEDRAAFIAGEVGGAVFSQISNGIMISRDTIVDALEAKRHYVVSVIYKRLSRNAAEFVRK